MISVRPGTDGFRALALIVARPGELDAEAVGQILFRPRITGTHDYLSVRAAMLAHGVRPPRSPLTRSPRWRPLPRPAAMGPSWTTAASKLIHGLQGWGYVERLRPPTIAEEWLDLAAEDAPEAVRGAAVGAEAFEVDPTGLRAALLAELVRRAPGSVTEWVGDAPSGHIQRAVQDLYEWGLVVPPTRRWPTPEGVAFVERHEETA